MNKKTALGFLVVAIILVAAFFVLDGDNSNDKPQASLSDDEALAVVVGYANSHTNYDEPEIKATRADKDLMIRTIYGEAVNEPRLGQIAVAWVIRNRLEDNKYGWNSLSKVVTSCGYIKRRGRRIKICQFEPWLRRGKELMRLKRSSRHYKAILAIVNDVLTGRAADPTEGAWHFLNKNIVQDRRKKQNRKMPGWAKNCIDIGRHSFCNPNSPAVAGWVGYVELPEK